MINFNALLADGPLPDPKTLASPPISHNDPSIDHGGQVIVYIGVTLFVLSVVALVGFFSRRVEYALFTALALSLGLVAFFIFAR